MVSVETFKDINFDNELPLLTLRTSSGKSSLAITQLRQYIEDATGKKYNKLFLISPYSRTSNQSLKDNRFIGQVRELNNKLINSVDFDTTRIEETIISTYSRLSGYLASGEIDLEGCICVIDELPTLLDMSCYCSNLSYLIEYLLDEQLFKKCLFVGLSGTPALIFDYANRLNLPYKFTDLTPEAPRILKAKKGKVIIKGSAKSYCQKLIQEGYSGCLLVYVQGVSDCFNLKKLFEDNGLNAAFVVSQHNKDRNPHTKNFYFEDMVSQIYDDINILEWIDEKSTIPKDLDALIINASAREGVNIMSDAISAVIVQSTSNEVIEQVRGRSRKQLIDELTVIYSTEYEHRAINNWFDANEFFINLKQSADPQTLIKDRLIAQLKADKQEEEYKNANNFAVALNTKPKMKRPQKLDYCVLESRKVFVNWFALAFVEYTLDTYQFCEKKQYVDVNTGDLVEETREIIKDGVKRPDIKTFFKPLNELLISGEFEFIKGSEITASINNRGQITDELLEKICSNDADEKWFTREELQEIADSLTIKNSFNNKAGYQTLVKELEKYCEITHKKKQIKGVRVWRYNFTKK